MRLLFIHQHLGALGGAEANIHLTARELKERGHAVALLHGSGTGRSEAAWQETFDQCFPLNQKSNSACVLEALHQFKPDVLYVHNMAELDVLEALIASRLPMVRMVHDHEMYCMRGYKYNYFTRTICQRGTSPYCVFPCLAFLGRSRNGGFPLRWVSYSGKKREIDLNRHCDRLVVYSDYSREQLRRNGFDPAKIEIHVPVRCWGTHAQVSSLDERNLILYVGQIVRGKGVDVLLESLARIRVPFECLILGDGSHKRHCERVCRKLGLSDRVHFKGFVQREELKNYFLQASVFVVSSVWPEPFGLVGPEAMRYGLPVVAFDAGGIREWLIDGENGFLVPWMDCDRLAARIEQLLTDKELARRMGRRGLEWVNEQYDASRQISELEGMFARVLEQARSRSRTVLPQEIQQCGQTLCE
jgi:glycosyltransferase involved in cell wall biosynthesis